LIREGAAATPDDGGFPPISDYAFLSDCHSLALVARDGSIEWAVFHRFDGRPVFARMLDRDVGGFFRIAPTEPGATITRRYLPGTNVLETTFRTTTGEISLTDFLPVESDEDEIGNAHQLGARHSLIRIVRGLSGSVDVGLTFRPRFEYGLTTPYITPLADDLIVAVGSADALLLQSEIGPLPRDGRGGVDSQARITAGEERVVTITWSTPSSIDTSRLPREQALASLDTTMRFWQTWSSHTRYEGPYRAAVERSALAIKGLTDGKTGAVIAAATTSLPETIGGGRNWDYRYTWVRDSTTMLNALIRLGHDFECRRFSDWIRVTTAGRADEVQIMYGIGGERVLTETELPHLSGYRGSRPVRIGNGAWNQSQLDTYGWLLASTWFSAAHTGNLGEHDDPHYARFVREVVDLAIDRFDETDEGIWEVRGGRQHFLFSKLLMWLAVDLGVRLIERHDGAVAVPGRWRHARDEMRRRIETEGVDHERGVFTQALGSTALDASALQIANLGFLPPDDPRVLATIEAIDRELGVKGHIYRYRGDDGLAGDEGSFVFCTLWMVTALARSGQLQRARDRFEMILSHASDLGLLAEEIDPHTGAQLGNFPQAFSHVGVISAALAIEAAENGTSDPRSAMPGQR
jgi:GH15 family glucan-1,4-alpha-glucosidase